MSVLSVFPKAHTFIETGYGRGETLERAAARTYERLVTIEVDDEVAEGAKRRWQHDTRVEVYTGSSAELLSEAIRPANPTMFWLDAHYSGGGYPADARIASLPQCPLLDELSMISQAPWAVPPIVFADDTGMFDATLWASRPGSFVGFRREEWPTFEDIEAAGFRFVHQGSWMVLALRRMEVAA